MRELNLLVGECNFQTVEFRITITVGILETHDRSVFSS
eukprot:COSAG02_NODE_32_length_50374_cov_46.674013_3_plen_38_part_00